MAITDEQVRTVLPSNPDSILTRYVKYAQRLVPSPHIYHVGVGLNLLSAVCPESLKLSRVFDMDVYPNMWNLLIGDSASGKTLAVVEGQRLLRSVVAALPGGNGSKLSPMGGDPRTEEGFRKSLERKPRQVLIYPDFGSFLGGTSGSHENNYRAKVRDMMVEVFDCLGYEGEKANDSIRIPPTRLSIMGGVTPSQLRAHTVMLDWDGGFMSRFMTFVGKPTPDREDFQPIRPDDPAQMERENWLASRLLLRCDPATIFDYNDGEPPETHPVPGYCRGMTVDAQMKWREFVHQLKGYEQDVDVRMGGCVRRVRVMAQKIALILSYDYGGAAMSNGDEWQLGVEELEPACGIALLHAQSLVGLTQSIAVNQNMLICNQILEKLPPDGEWLHRGVLMKRVGLLSRETKYFLETLEERGEIELFSESSGHQYVRLIEGGAPPEFDYGVVAEGMDNVG